MKPLKVAYHMMHGATRVLIPVHRELFRRGVVQEAPAAILFNRYWASLLKDAFPTAQTLIHPNQVDYWAGKGHPRVFSDEAAFERAWRMDRILAEKPKPFVRWIWGESLQRIDAFLEETRPDVIVADVMQSLPCYAIFTVAVKRKIPFLQLTMSRLGGTRLELHNDISGVPYGLDETPAAEAWTWADNYLSRLRETSTQATDSLKYYKQKKIKIRKEDARKTFNYLQEISQGGLWEVTRGSVIAPFTSKLRKLLGPAQSSVSPEYAKLSEVLDLPLRRLLFPLHITPEASTLTWAPAYTRMGETLSHISRHLPSDWLLLAKEHPVVTTAFRDPEEIAQIRQLPNVALLSPFENNEELLKVCEGVITINGTLGLEALLVNKPVITLGHPFYDQSGNTIVCPDLKGLPEALQQLSSERVDGERNRRFLAAYHQLSADGAYANPDLFDTAYAANLLSETNIHRIVDFLTRQLFGRWDDLRERVEQGRIKTI